MKKIITVALVVVLLMVSAIVPASACSNPGSYCRWQEVIFTQFAEFTLTIEDAQEYVYSISLTKRVRGWRDIEVKLYI